MKILVSLIFLTSLIGCVPFPIYKTLQPNSSATVLDSTGKPIEGAKVELISLSYPYGFEKFRITAWTNYKGETHFVKMKEWRIEMPLMLHGQEVFFWNWCVSKEGYSTIQTDNKGSSTFEADSSFTLIKGVSNACQEER